MKAVPIYLFQCWLILLIIVTNAYNKCLTYYYIGTQHRL